MSTEFPYSDLTKEQTFESILESSATKMWLRDEKFIIGFSLVQDGVTKNFISRELGLMGDFTIYFKHLCGRLAEERKYPENSPQARLDHVGWFIGTPKELKKLDPRHTTIFA